MRVTISDTGCGIPAEHLPNVKKKFYKANQLVRGSGIGLAVADEIVRLHGGTLEIDSQEGRGYHRGDLSAHLLPSGSGPPS